ncbi:hypothetical protein H6A33_10250 [Collinsella tanakaei]|nr:hypothetical protein [Collinsella tanakaei]
MATRRSRKGLGKPHFTLAVRHTRAGTSIHFEEDEGPLFAILIGGSIGGVLSIYKMGNEATERFIARHSAQYGEKDWGAIKEAICDEVAYIIWDTTPAAPRTMLRPTAVKEFYEVIRSNDGKGYGGEAYGTLSITYQLNDSIPKIVGANSPVLSVRYYMGDAMAANTVGVSTWKTISSDGSRLDFGATYSVSMSFAPGFTPIWSGMAGPYSVSSATFA